MDRIFKFLFVLVSLLLISRAAEILDQPDSCARLYSEDNYGGQLIEVHDGSSVQIAQDSVANSTLSLLVQNGCVLTACYGNESQLECLSTQKNASEISTEYQNMFSANCTCQEGQNAEEPSEGDVMSLEELLIKNLITIESNQATFRQEQRAWRDEISKEIQDIKKLLAASNAQNRFPTTNLRLRPDRVI